MRASWSRVGLGGLFRTKSSASGLADKAVALDALPVFDQAVYRRARAIPFGRVVIYGEIA